MFRYLSAVAALFVVLGATLAGGEEGKTTISWHGQSFFTIKTSKGTIIATDPHAISNYGRVIGQKAHVCLISHFHNDHTQVDVLENHKDKDFKVIEGLVGKGNRADWAKIDTTFKDVKIRTVGVYHDDEEGLKSGKNAVFIIEVDGWKIAHLGDLGHVLSDAQVKAIGPIDVLMIPVGGVYTINGAEALKVVAQLKPKEYIIPMHFGTPIFDDLLSPAEFVDGFPKDKVVKHTHNTLTLQRGDKRAPTVQVLHYWPTVKKEKKDDKEK